MLKNVFFCVCLGSTSFNDPNHARMKTGKTSRRRLWYMVKQRLKMSHRAKFEYFYTIALVLLATAGVVLTAVCNTECASVNSVVYWSFSLQHCLSRERFLFFSQPIELSLFQRKLLYLLSTESGCVASG